MRTVTVIIMLAMPFLGCRTLSPQNTPLYEEAGSGGYRLSNTPPGDQNSNSLFVLLAFSGGGSRAAAFSYGVLEKLRDTEIDWGGQPHRFLDEVDVISSVSGGSITAAYYGLFGDQIFENFSEDVLCRNIVGDFLSRAFTPVNLFRLTSPKFGRTDILGKLFTEEIYEDNTFADLAGRNERPYIIINATDIALGSRFEFTQQQFDLLNSDLSTYPIGYAVAASSAYPGFLTPVTLRNFPKGDDFRAPAWIAEEQQLADSTRIRYPLFRNHQSYLLPDRPYIHLIDGGVSDNLGLLPVIQFAGAEVASESIQIGEDHDAVKKFIIILVNAKQPIYKEINTQQKVMNVFKVMVSAGKSPMTNFSDLQTAYLRTYIRTLTETQRIREKVVRIAGEEEVRAKLPELDVPDIEYHFIEVAFDSLDDPDEMDYLNRIPTTFRLEREQAERLRKAAGKILDAHPDFQKLLEGLRD